MEPALGACAGEHVDGGGVALEREGRVAGTAVDVRPGRRVDHGLDAGAIEALARPARIVQVELGARPRDRAAGPGRRRFLERRDQGPPEPAAGAGDGDTHP